MPHGENLSIDETRRLNRAKIAIEVARFDRVSQLGGPVTSGLTPEEAELAQAVRHFADGELDTSKNLAKIGVF